MNTQKAIHTAIGILMLFAAVYVMSIAWKAGQKGFSKKLFTGEESGYKKLRCERDSDTGECTNLTNNQPVHCYKCGTIRS